MFLFRGRESHPRSLAKAVSWRTLGSIDTFVLGLIFTSSVKAAGSIALTEVFTKILLYYFHERAWAAVRWGGLPDTPPPARDGEIAPPPPATPAAAAPSPRG